MDIPEGSRRAIVGGDESDTGDLIEEDSMGEVQEYNLVACNDVVHGSVDFEVIIVHPDGRVDPCGRKTTSDIKLVCEKYTEGCLRSVLQACAGGQNVEGDDQESADDQDKIVTDAMSVAKSIAEDPLEVDDVESSEESPIATQASRATTKK